MLLFVVIFNIILLVFKLVDDYNSIGLTLTFIILLSSNVIFTTLNRFKTLIKLSTFIFVLTLIQNNIISVERIQTYLKNETEDLSE